MSLSHDRKLAWEWTTLAASVQEKTEGEHIWKKLKLINVSLCAFTAPQAKERCICSWTRYTNLLVWFDNFKLFLIEFGFAIVGCNGEPVFDEKIMHQILNLDAMDISDDGSNTIVGGRPESHSMTLTYQCQVWLLQSHCNAHWHFWKWHHRTVCACALAATIECNSRRKEEALLQVLVPRAQHTWQVWMHHWVDGKGGMNNEEFEHYIDNSIVPLFPNLEDMSGKCILLNIDSGRGWNWRDLLNKCWFRGVYIYLGLPNSTSMQQETEINFYGPFKGFVQRNLAKIAMTCYAKEITMSLGVGILPDGYVRTNPLPQVPTKQSVQTSRIHLPTYFGLPISLSGSFQYENYDHNTQWHSLYKF